MVFHVDCFCAIIMKWISSSFSLAILNLQTKGESVPPKSNVSAAQDSCKVLLFSHMK